MTYQTPQVQNRVDGWVKKGPYPSLLAQLEWEAHIVEYVTYIYGLTKVHGNATKGTLPKPLPREIPLLGPQFVPPSYLHAQRRHGAPDLKPQSAYLKSLNIIHPFYYPMLARCPQCKSDSVLWDGWTNTGARDVHGVSKEERALGTQLRCNGCEDSEPGENARGKRFRVATTNPLFWEKWEHWEVPSSSATALFKVKHIGDSHHMPTDGIPHFFKRCAVTRELFNLIVEFRPSQTSGGLAENIKRECHSTWKMCDPHRI